MKKYLFSVLSALLFIGVSAHANPAETALCEAKARTMAEQLERTMGDRRTGRLQLQSLTKYSDSHSSTVVVRVAYTDNSLAFYEVKFGVINGRCYKMETIRRSSN